ncbi:hypothetical protein MRX96_029306 [Rhipicephalus microplus]
MPPDDRTLGASTPLNHEWTAATGAHAASHTKQHALGHHARHRRSSSSSSSSSSRTGTDRGSQRRAQPSRSAYYYDYVARGYVDGRRAGRRHHSRASTHTRACVCRDAPPRAATCRTKGREEGERRRHDDVSGRGMTSRIDPTFARSARVRRAPLAGSPHHLEETPETTRKGPTTPRSNAAWCRHSSARVAIGDAAAELQPRRHLPDRLHATMH